jgi:NADPH-dependent F420 reductase
LLGDKVFVEGTTNIRAVELADIVVLTVPYAAHRETLESVREALQGKILIDVTVPLVPPKVTRVQMPAAGSAAQEAHAILGQNVQVTSAFQNISYELLFHPEPIECDVLVTGTSKEARLDTLKLVVAAGLTGWDAGPIENSVVLEGLTSILININRESGSKNAGIKITGTHSGSTHNIAL